MFSREVCIKEPSAAQEVIQGTTPGMDNLAQGLVDWPPAFNHMLWQASRRQVPGGIHAINHSTNYHE